MGAPKGNQFWRNRIDLNSEFGKKLTPAELAEKCEAYLKGYIDNPIEETDYRGKDAASVTLYKPRAMTEESLCFYVGVALQTWDNWKKDKKYLGIITRVEQFMYLWNFEGAAANQMHANLMSRKLRLSDVQEVTNFQRPILEGGKELPGDNDTPEFGDKLLD